MSDVGNGKIALVKTASDPPPFIIGQEKRPVASIVNSGDVNGTSDNETKLILTQFWKGFLKRRLCIKRVVAEKLERRAMQLVRTTLGDDADLVGAKAVLR